MQLFNRFVDLDGSNLEQPPMLGAVKLKPGLADIYHLFPKNSGTDPQPA